MYAGRVVEEASVNDLFGSMRHRYTEALLETIPRLDRDDRTELYSIPGLPPDLAKPPPGCRFAPRCRHATAVCRQHEPALIKLIDGWRYACHHPADRGVREASPNS
jgi:oligopeptide/dipeptide ABC transporter ATP-binding protein